MSINPLNDISKVYLEHVASQQLDEISANLALAASKEAGKRAGVLSALSGGDPKVKAKAVKKREQSERLYKKQAKKRVVKVNPIGEEKDDSYLETDIDKRRKNNEKAVEDMKKTKAYRDMAAAARKKFDEALDPVGQEDADVDNDGKKNTKSDKYLLKRRKAIGQAISTRKESFSNWRGDLIEVMDVIDKEKNDEKITEKKVNNKIKINPNMGEAVENLGGTLLEMVEIEDLECVLDNMSESEIFLLNDDLIEEVVEEVFDECLEEGYDVYEIENVLLESLELSTEILNEAKVTLGHDTKIKSDRVAKVKSAVKKVGKAVARGVGYAAGAAVRGAKAVGREVSSGYQRGRQGSGGESSSGSSDSGSSTSSKSGSSRPGLLGRIGSALKSGLKRAVAKGARAVSRGARNVARKMEGSSSSSSSTPTSTTSPSTKAKPTKPSDPWEGSATTPQKAKTKKAASPKAKAPAAAKPKAKRKSKLDTLLADIRSEQVQIDEKTLTAAETKKKEDIVMSMKSKAKDFEKRYPGRGKEVMYATATKMAKKMSEQAMEVAPKTQQPDQQDQKAKIASQRAKQTAINLKQRELQALRSTPAGTQVSGFGG